MLRRGRFKKPMESLASKYTSSMAEDVRIFYPTVQVNIAHTIMLGESGIISRRDASALLRALVKLHGLGISKLDLRDELEDIHMAVEEFVAKEAGEEIGGKLNTAKSRNDQVATALRLVLRKRLLEVGVSLLGLIDKMLALAEGNVETVMPGYTHLQIAEPTTFAHYLSAYCAALFRDVDRILEAYESINSCPMGACAFASTSFPINRARVASLLGFKRLDENTMDAVGSRDFALRAMGDLAITMIDLSRLAEELFLWTSVEFDMIEMSDDFVATSSIMPQKRNPVVAEMVRAKTARVMGNLTGALSLMKALPQAYNLDLQELTPILWSTVDETSNTVEVMRNLIGGVKPKKGVMRERAERGFSIATELADTLVRKAGLSFRDAHSVVGRLVTRAIEDGKSAKELGVEDLRVASKEVLGREVAVNPEILKAALDVDNCVISKSPPGGPAPKSVLKQLRSFSLKSKQRSNLVSVWRGAINRSEVELLKVARRKS